MKIKTKVLFLMGTVLVSILVLTVLGRRGLGELLKSLESFDEGAVSTISFLEIEVLSKELEQAVHLYSFTGYKSFATRVNDISNRLHQDLVRERRDSSNEAMRFHLDEMINQLTAYRSSFKQVVEERSLRSEIVESQMAGTFEKIEQDLYALSKFGNSRDFVRGAEKELYSANFHANQYFLQLDASDVDMCIENLGKLRDLVGGIVEASESTESVALANSVLTESSNYEAEFLRAVQATRGYLFLVNVVMTAEVVEFSYSAAQLKRMSQEALSQLRQKTQGGSAFQRRYFSIVSLSLVLVGLTLAFVFARSIVSPLQQLTFVFSRLSSGEKVDVVPGLDRSDEIGDMSRAAEVFRKKNAETEELLFESKRLTVDLDQKSKELFRANSEMESFVYTVSHDLKTPIVTSQGFIGMMRDMAEDGQYQAAMGLVDRLEAANDRMREMIKDLLDLSKVGRVNVATEVVDVADIIARIRVDLSRRLSELGFELIVQDELPKVQANKASMIQVFENLIGNALKYGASSDENGQNRIFVGGEIRQNGDVSFFVTDFGNGIDPKHQGKIFDLFQRASTDSEGSGIGLCIVRKIMLLHGGSVEVESELGKGATFRLHFSSSGQSSLEQSYEI